MAEAATPSPLPPPLLTVRAVCDEQVNEFLCRFFYDKDKKQLSLDFPMVSVQSRLNVLCSVRVLCERVWASGV